MNKKCVGLIQLIVCLAVLSVYSSSGAREVTQKNTPVLQKQVLKSGDVPRPQVPIAISISRIKPQPLLVGQVPVIDIWFENKSNSHHAGGQEFALNCIAATPGTAGKCPAGFGYDAPYKTDAMAPGEKNQRRISEKYTQPAMAPGKYIFRIMTKGIGGKNVFSESVELEVLPNIPPVVEQLTVKPERPMVGEKPDITIVWKNETAFQHDGGRKHKLTCEPPAGGVCPFKGQVEPTYETGPVGPGKTYGIGWNEATLDVFKTPGKYMFRVITEGFPAGEASILSAKYHVEVRSADAAYSPPSNSIERTAYLLRESNTNISGIQSCSTQSGQKASAYVETTYDFKGSCEWLDGNQGKYNSKFSFTAVYNTNKKSLEEHMSLLFLAKDNAPYKPAAQITVKSDCKVDPYAGGATSSACTLGSITSNSNNVAFSKNAVGENGGAPAFIALGSGSWLSKVSKTTMAKAAASMRGSTSSKQTSKGQVASTVQVPAHEAAAKQPPTQRHRTLGGLASARASGELGSGLAELSIVQFVAVPARPKPGDKIVLNVRISNTGTASSLSNQKVKLRCTAAYGTCPFLTGEYPVNKAIPAKGSFDFKLTSTGGAKEGSYSLSVMPVGGSRTSHKQLKLIVLSEVR